MGETSVIEILELGFPWTTFDPFLFCVHHDDAYPAGNDSMGPDEPLDGRSIGQDFAGKDGWRMYHGDVVPGFPRHPHRGFETITLARDGFIDHSDSLGATARLGKGDVQWMTAGNGIVHSEMFPLVHRQEPNRTGLFQIWLNLPRADKMTHPHFAMFWRESIPQVHFEDESNEGSSVSAVAGSIGGATPLSPPPHSWASRPESGIAIWPITMSPGARLQLPPAATGVNRTLYFFAGRQMKVGEAALPPYTGARLIPDHSVELINGEDEAELLLLQGRPIGEPVAQQGPFVMNSFDEIQQAFADYRRTEYGGWPWPTDGPVHAREEGRFARHADGTVDRP